MNNCPNCGAPIDSYKCEYCGTVHSDVVQDRIDYLHHKNEILKRNIVMEEMYIEALKAMAVYARY